MSKYRQSLGRWGESLAADFLARMGYEILECNVRTPYGEIDLVTRQPGYQGSPLVFVEVKTRASRAFGLPEESITSRKRMHMLEAAQSYLQTHPELDGDWRIDVIAIQRQAAGLPPVITHFENALG